MCEHRFPKQTVLYQSGPKSQRGEAGQAGCRTGSRQATWTAGEGTGAGLGSGSWEGVEVRTEGRIRNLREIRKELNHTSFLLRAPVLRCFCDKSQSGLARGPWSADGAQGLGAGRAAVRDS